MFSSYRVLYNNFAIHSTAMCNIFINRKRQYCYNLILYYIIINIIVIVHITIPIQRIVLCVIYVWCTIMYIMIVSSKCGENKIFTALSASALGLG